MTDLNSIETSEAEAIDPAPGSIRVDRPAPLVPDAMPDDWENAVRCVFITARKHDNTVASHWLDAMQDELLRPRAKTAGQESEPDSELRRLQSENEEQRKLLGSVARAITIPECATALAAIAEHLKGTK